MASGGSGKGSSVSSKMKAKKHRAKKQTDAMSKKEFYNLTLPPLFSVRKAGVTMADRSQGEKFAPDALRGRTFEVNQADLSIGANSQSHRKFKFAIDGVRGRDAISSFHGMELTSDKCKSIPKKWYSLIEAETKVTTTDGYSLRVFTIALTKRKAKSVKKLCYATLSQIKAIRKIVIRIIEEELSSCGINEVIKKLMNETIGTRMEQEGVKIYPLQNCHVKKVKVIKRPRVDESSFDRRTKETKNIEIEVAE
jgi:small subunit ribosomal protein S3Ae